MNDVVIPECHVNAFKDDITAKTIEGAEGRPLRKK